MNALWFPPENPDPSKILHEAPDDVRGRRFETALCKYVWFYDCAARIQPSLSGVRLSFALGYWHELAKSYPPAMEALIAARNEAESAFIESGYGFKHFQELSAINRHLGEFKRVVDLFKRVARLDEEAARGIYQVAEPYLIKEGEFAACAPFLDTEQRMSSLSRTYQVSSNVSRDSNLPGRAAQVTRNLFTNGVATLIALLVLNDRETDAKAAYSEALKTLDDAEFRTALDAAMTGHFPAPGYG